MSQGASVMAGKRGLIMGVANDRSIAWAIAKMAADHGAELAFTYQGDALRKRVEPLAVHISVEVITRRGVLIDVCSLDAECAEGWGWCCSGFFWRRRRIRFWCF